MESRNRLTREKRAFASLLQQLDDVASQGSLGQERIRGQQRSADQLRERDVGGVVRGEIRAKPPDPVDEELMRIALDQKGGVRLDRLLGTLIGHLSRQVVSAKDLQNLHG